MTASYTYDGDDLPRVRSGSVGMTQCAENLQVGSGTLTVNDKAGTTLIVGQKDFAADESACSNTITARGFIGPRTYGRNSERQTVSREIGFTIQDLNAMAGFRRLRVKSGMTAADAGKRPAETVAERGAWMMASPFVDGLFADNGRCDFPADKGMDAADYRNQFPGDVFADMVLAALGYNAYIREFGDGPELVFRNDNISTDDTSTIVISNDLDDVVGDTDGLTFAPFKDAVLTRDPSHVISDLGYQYAKGSKDIERPATEDDFNGERGGTASNSNIKTAAKAFDEGTSILFQRSTEEDTIECTIQLPSDKVNLVNHGDRISAKFTHLTPEGYGDFSWFRVLECTKTPLLKAAALYNVKVKLSPQEAGPPVPLVPTIVQTAVLSIGPAGGTASFPNPVTVGSLLVYMACKGEGGGPGPDAPNTDIALPRWGAGAWTDSTPGTARVAWDDPRAYQDAMKVWTKIADSTSASCQLDQYTSGVCFEIAAPATMSGATFVYKDLQTFASTYAIGSLGTPSAGKLAFLILALGAGAADPVTPLVALNSGVWIRDLHADNVGHVWGSDDNAIGFNQPAPPETWIGHTIATGAALAATLTDTYGHKWGGIAVLLA